METYFLNDIEYKFDNITTQDALKFKNLIMVLADDKSSLADKMNANEQIDKMAFKYLLVKQKNEQGKDEFFKGDKYGDAALIHIFNNEFYAVEIVATFQKRLQGFLQKLPSFQNLK